MKAVGTSRSGAMFSDCGKYRYRLWRCWDPELPRACFIMLNPSTADEVNNDPTIERQQRRVERWSQADLFGDGETKFGSIEVVNACAYRSTNPQALYKIDNPIGDDNGDAIDIACREAVESGGIIVCGWGSHLLKLGPHGTTYHDILREALEEFPLRALKLNQDGTPQHPLYLSYSLLPRRWQDGQLLEG